MLLSRFPWAYIHLCIWSYPLDFHLHEPLFHNFIEINCLLNKIRLFYITASKEWFVTCISLTILLNISAPRLWPNFWNNMFHIYQIL